MMIEKIAFDRVWTLESNGLKPSLKKCERALKQVKALLHSHPRNEKLKSKKAFILAVMDQLDARMTIEEVAADLTFSDVS